MSKNTIVVFVPGTTASEITLNVNRVYGTTEVWPDIIGLGSSAADQVREAAYALALEDSSKTATIGDIVDNFPTSPTTSIPCYASLKAFFTNPGNFKDNEAFTYDYYGSSNQWTAPPPSKLFYAVPYDWRQDNTTSGSLLNDALKDLDTQYSANGGEYDLYLMAHSNGGLVSRYLLESIKPTTSNWWSNLKMLITLATPHLGAPLAWSAITGQMDPNKPVIEIFLQSIVDNNAFPSTFELLPPKGLNFIYDASGAGQDIYAAANAGSGQLYTDMETCKVNMQNLSTASTFFNSLSPDLKNLTVPYYFYYGTGRPTLSPQENPAFLYIPKQGKPDEIFQRQAVGDGVVPATSGSFYFSENVTTTSFYDYTHGQMGGSDMTNAPNSILTAAVVMGLNPTQSPS